MPRITSDYEQEPPFAIQVELVEGCNLRCSFCGLNGIRGKDNDFKFMHVHVIESIVRSIKKSGWNPRIEFAMHGEPSYYPSLGKALRRFRRRLPKSFMMMTSNGGGFLKNPTVLIDEALQHLNVLALDDYEGTSIVQKILQHYEGDYEPIYYPSDPSGNPHRRRSLDSHELVIIQDIEKASKGTHAILNNHAGAGAPKNDSAQGKRCAKPFREMSIRWDGNVAICCNDWRGEFKCGNVLKMSLNEIWNCLAMRAARRKLYHGERDFGPCNGCDAISYRTGLLPDKKGLESLPRATSKDHHEIEAALAGEPYTAPVLRHWERKNKPPQPKLGGL